MATQYLLAGAADVETLMVMMKELQADDPWEEPFDQIVLRTNLERLLGNAVYGTAYIARDGNEAAGYVVVCFDYSLEYRGKGAWVDELFVRRPKRGKGIGTQLLYLAEVTAREQGAQAIHLEVNYGNAAKELYRRRGYQEHQRFLMTKRLTG